MYVRQVNLNFNYFGLYQIYNTPQQEIFKCVQKMALNNAVQVILHIEL